MGGDSKCKGEGEGSLYEEGEGGKQRRQWGRLVYFENILCIRCVLVSAKSL